MPENVILTKCLQKTLPKQLTHVIVVPFSVKSKSSGLSACRSETKLHCVRWLTVLSMPVHEAFFLDMEKLYRKEESISHLCSGFIGGKQDFIAHKNKSKR